MSKEEDRLRRLAALRQQAAEAAMARGHDARAAGEKALRGMGDPTADLARASNQFAEQSARLDAAMDTMGAALDVDNDAVDAVVRQAQQEATANLLRRMPAPPKGMPGKVSAPVPRAAQPALRPVAATRVGPPPPVVSAPDAAADSFEGFKTKIDARIATGQKEVAAYCRQQGLNIDQAKRAFAESMTNSREEITTKLASFTPGTLEHKILGAALKMVDIDRRINTQNIADANSVSGPYKRQAMAYSANNIVAKKNNSRNRVAERNKLKASLERKGIQGVEKKPGLFGRVTRQIKKWWEKLAGKPKETLAPTTPASSKAAIRVEPTPSTGLAKEIARKVGDGTPAIKVSPTTSPSARGTGQRGQSR